MKAINNFLQVITYCYLDNSIMEILFFWLAVVYLAKHVAAKTFPSHKHAWVEQDSRVLGWNFQIKSHLCFGLFLHCNFCATLSGNGFPGLQRSVIFWFSLRHRWGLAISLFDVKRLPKHCARQEKKKKSQFWQILDKHPWAIDSTTLLALCVLYCLHLSN